MFSINTFQRRSFRKSHKNGVLGLSALIAYAMLPIACSTSPEECTDECRNLGGSPEGEGSGGKGSKGGASSGGRSSSDGGREASGGAGAGERANTGGKASFGGEGGVGSGGLNMGGEPVVLVPSLDVEFDLPEVLRLDQGGHFDFAVSVLRGGGFDGPVRLSISSDPAGTELVGEVVVGTGDDKADVSLRSDDGGQTGGPFEVELVATGLDGELVAQQTFLLFVAGRPGSVDTSFGEGGILFAGMTELLDLEKSPSGAVFLAGNSPATLRRVGADGSWTDSPEFSELETLSARLSALAVDDAKVWLGIGTGTSGDPYAVARLTHTGAKDVSFDSDGILPTAEVHELALRPGGDAWMVVTDVDYPSFNDVFAVGVTGALGVKLNYSGGHKSLRVDGQDRLWVASSCDCGNGSGSWLNRVLPDGSTDPSFGPGYGYWDQVLTPFGRSRTLGFAGNTINALDENGKLLSSFGSGGKLTFPYDDWYFPAPTVVDVATRATGSIVVLETPEGRVESVEVPASVLVFDELGVPLPRFSGGVLDVNWAFPALTSASKQLFPRKVIIDEEWGRALVAVEVIPDGETEPVDVALVRIWL